MRSTPFISFVWVMTLCVNSTFADESARRHERDERARPARVIIPGPPVIGVHYGSGEVVEYDTEWRFGSMCGGAALDAATLKKVAAEMYARANEPNRQIQGIINGNSGCGVSITFNIDGSVPAAANAAIQLVADYFSETFSDDITFVINLDFANLGGSVLGATGSNYVLNVNYASTRFGLQFGMDDDDTIQDFLPTGSSVPVRYTGSNDAISNQTSIDITNANYRAAVGGTSGTSASMTFNSNFSWDYNGPPCNNLSEFQTVLVHEVGHALGFTSNADFGNNDMDLLDLYRFQFTDNCAGGGNCDYNPDDESEFQTTPRLVDFNSPNDDATSDIGTAEWRMEDGTPSQASHFRQSVAAIMDPNFVLCEYFGPNFLKTADLAMFDAIGWDYPPNSPCDDSSACTIDDVCTGVACTGTAVDCSGMSTDCLDVTCDPSAAPGNCDIATPVNEGNICNTGTGVCQNGACIAPGDTRSFMTAPGNQALAPTTGPTSLTMIQGGVTTIEVWIADTDPQQIGGYQLAFPGQAVALAGATGTIEYVDNVATEGDSVTIDSSNPNWVFSGEAGVDVFLSEIGLPVGFAMIAVLPVGQGVNGDGLQYAGEFQVSASGDALGAFELRYLFDGEPPNGGTALTDNTGVQQIVSALQPLHINVIESGQCVTVEDCGDLNGDNISDDNCKWYGCSGFVCTIVDRVFADAAGPFGDCPPDGFANIHDYNHTLTCFSGINPCSSLNIDIGGPFGTCPSDGFCNIHDANHTLSSFSGINTCLCPGNPAPEFGPDVVGESDITFAAARHRANPGDLIEVRVLLGEGQPNLQSYQLDVEAAGGRSGALKLVDIRLAPAKDAVFAGANDAFAAFNVAKGQMLGGVRSSGLGTADGAYLASFMFEATPDARGDFVVDLRPAGQTFLIAEYDDMILIDTTSPAVITIGVGRRARTR
jgi:hypothetical protein